VVWRRGSRPGLRRRLRARAFRLHSACQRHFAEIGSACRRRCGQSQSCQSACQKREDAYAGECNRRNRACVRACGGR
jgi:hypothetical protein